MKNTRIYLALLLPFAMIAALFWCAGCQPKSVHYEPLFSTDTTTAKTLLWGVPTQSYYEITDLFVKYLNERLKDVKVQTVASSTFKRFMEKLDSGDFDLTIANGIKALECARNDYRIIAESIDEHGYAGAILVNADSAINSFSDLKGKTIASPGNPALAGHMMQMLYLSKNKIDVNRDLKIDYLESFESVYLNIYLGKCSAGFATSTSWYSFVKSRPEIAAKVKLKWVTPKLPGNALLLRKDVNQQTAEKLKDLIFSMDTDEQGRQALDKIGFRRFAPADSNTY
ncbi:MAG TPA: phosphate/phosphite/phosphonate ABC transporter substrate-binding protein, partial [Flavisolibacter sp.]|nr:phosphate/phosphite/phosphonate ABC transporter substrate-binding protein [Flavisolibacter sp.]